AIAGNLPAVRIAAWAGRANGTNVAVPSTGPSVTLTTYGEVVSVSAIIGSGNRQGVDMVWGTEPIYGHFGLDLTGANGGVVRIDDIVIEDVTEVFHRKLLDLVDVRDYGAIGNGVANDAPAFAAADAAANGRTVLVSAGTYFLGANVTFGSSVRFEGTVTMPVATRLACTRNYDLDTYAAAFGSELEGLRRGLQVLFFFTDHVTFDLSGRRVDLTGPIDVAAISGVTTFAQRRVLANGQLNAVANTAWDTQIVSAVATYNSANATQLTAVANIANIPVGARITGTGVGREVYVRAKNVGAGTITLSKPLWAAAGTRTFTFTRYRYMLDFSGFDALSRFEIIDMELLGNGIASAIMLATSGSTFRLADSVINRPKDRGISSVGVGCQGLFVDQCQFLSDEQATPAQDRTTIALNTNANDCKIRDNRIVRFAHFAVIGGTGNMLIGNHFFQGDDQTNGVRQAGVVFTSTNLATLFTGNYVDNSWIEWSNEHDPLPGFNNEFSFGGLTITANIFIASNVSPAFRWLVIKPRGPGHFISGLSMTGNTFRTVAATVDRVEMVDTTNATLEFGMMRNVVIEANTFNGITRIPVNPVTMTHVQNTPASTWVVDGSDFLPFGGWARNVSAVVAETPLTTVANVVRSEMPYVQVQQGVANNQVHLRWPVEVKGRVQVTLRCDNPN
ncbi:MAG: right-handed parallel beta-helix repeat-containing protein, partial [Paracoccaceae bacterium]|nr:right-handed parallel beta-helix repeat-containing protein [Paracoccaceae bacterium]